MFQPRKQQRENLFPQLQNRIFPRFHDFMHAAIFCVSVYVPPFFQMAGCKWIEFFSLKNPPIKAYDKSLCSTMWKWTATKWHLTPSDFWAQYLCRFRFDHLHTAATWRTFLSDAVFFRPREHAFRKVARPANREKGRDPKFTLRLGKEKSNRCAIKGLSFGKLFSPLTLRWGGDDAASCRLI